MADTFDPVAPGLPVTYGITVRNIGDAAGGAEVVFTPGSGWTQLDARAVTPADCNGGELGGGTSCRANLAPDAFMAFIVTGSYAVSGSAVATAVRTGDPDGNPANDQATETTQVVGP